MLFCLLYSVLLESLYLNFKDKILLTNTKIFTSN